MKIALYTPYLNTVGGGEKYMLTIAEVLAEHEEVEILLGSHLYDLDREVLKNKVLKMHNINLSKIKFTRAPIGEGCSAMARSLFLRQYDWFFYLTDGSVFYSTAKHNVIHFQVPFQNIGARGLKGKIKLSSWEKAIYNSRFTEEIVESHWPIKNGVVVYPPVDVETLHPLKKKNQILSVGRFHMATKLKKQGVMIEAFKEFSKENKKLEGWSLHLAGGVEEGNEGYVEELKALGTGADIVIHPNISISELHTLYGESKIYWHAAGFGEDDPTKFEHFGITTVEAMAAGCVPVVINKGGQREILTKDCGFVWDSLDELKAETLTLIGDASLMNRLSNAAQIRAKNYDREHFERAIKKIVYG